MNSVLILARPPSKLKSRLRNCASRSRTSSNAGAPRGGYLVNEIAFVPHAAAAVYRAQGSGEPSRASVVERLNVDGLDYPAVAGTRPCRGADTGCESGCVVGGRFCHLLDSVRRRHFLDRRSIQRRTR